MEKYNPDLAFREKSFSLTEILGLVNDIKQSKHSVQISQNVRAFFQVEHDKLLILIKNGQAAQSTSIPLLLKYAELAESPVRYTQEELERFYKVHSCVRHYNEAFHYLNTSMQNVGLNCLKLALNLQEEFNIADEELNICQEKLNTIRTQVPIVSIRDCISRASTYGNNKSSIEKLVKSAKNIADEFKLDLSSIKVNDVNINTIENNLQALA